MRISLSLIYIYSINSLKIGYINAKIETYILNPLRFQKYRHRDKCTPINCKEYPAYSQEYKTFKRLTEIKCTNIFPEARKIEQIQEKEQSSYAYITKRKQVKGRCKRKN